jgi:hypothetical protein
MFDDHYRRSVPEERAALLAEPWAKACRDVEVGPAATPRLDAALCALTGDVAHRGQRVGALLDRSFFGVRLIPVGWHRATWASWRAWAEPPVAQIERAWVGALTHELAHGPARVWTGDPGAWTALEAAAAWVAGRRAPWTVYPEGGGSPADAVPGLVAFAQIGAALMRAVGEAPLLALCGLHGPPATDLGAVLPQPLASALHRADRGAWPPSPPFSPDPRDTVAWVRLIEHATRDAAPAWLDDPAIDVLEQARREPPARSRRARPTLDAIRWCVEPLFTVVRHRGADDLPALAVAAPQAPPRSAARVDTAALTLRADPRPEGWFGEPAEVAWPAAWPKLPDFTPRELFAPDAPTLAEALAGLLDRADAISLPGDSSMFDESFGASPPRVDVRADLPRLSASEPVVAIGSCFAENVGIALADAGMDVDVNPFGRLYDPVSVARAIRLLLSPAPLPDDRWIFDRARWHSLAHHTDFSDADRAYAVARAEARRVAARDRLRGGRTLLLTWGTRRARIDRVTGHVAANTHGLDASRFEARELSVDEIATVTAEAIAALRAELGDVRVILSVSPVPHLADGVVADQRSKAALLLAAEALERDGIVAVFPAYEIMNVELRDLRWLRDDHAHPTPAAVDVIVDRFLDSCCTAATGAEIRRQRDLARRLRALPSDPLRRRDALLAWRAEATAPALAPGARPPHGPLAWADEALAALSWLDQPPRSTAPPVSGAPGAAPEAAAEPTPPAEGPALEESAPPGAPPPEPLQLAGPVPAEEEAKLRRLDDALGMGRWIDHDALPSWVEEVRLAADALAATASPGAIRRAIAALDVRADEIADPLAATPAREALTRAWLARTPPSDPDGLALLDRALRGEIGPDVLRDAGEGWRATFTHALRERRDAARYTHRRAVERLLAAISQA